ncbi:Uncharacterised protein [Vibrio cholerae]|nr:Uncharacterised protein [Vibrio cholerae]
MLHRQRHQHADGLAHLYTHLACFRLCGNLSR